VANAEMTRRFREGLDGLRKISLFSFCSSVASTMQFPDSATHLLEKRLTLSYDSYVVMYRRLGGVTEPYDVGWGLNFGIVEWGSGFIGVMDLPGGLTQIEKETPEKRA